MQIGGPFSKIEPRAEEGPLLKPLAARADFIFSGDKRVRNLKHYQHMRIVNATEALAIIDSQIR